MMPGILEFIRRASSDFSIPAGRVLEVGSYNINGSPREVIPADGGYTGVDMMPGPGVDIVMDAEHLAVRFPPAAFDTVVCCECLEHTVRPWRVVEAMQYVLRPGGHLWVSTPTFGFPLHRYPVDCYRFGEDAYRLWLFAGMDLLRLCHITDHLGQPAIAAVGRLPAG